MAFLDNHVCKVYNILDDFFASWPNRYDHYPDGCAALPVFLFAMALEIITTVL